METEDNRPVIADFQLLPIEGQWYWEWTVPGTDVTFAGFQETQSAAADAAFEVITRHYEGLN